MSISHVYRVFTSAIPGGHKHVSGLRAGLAILLAMTLVGCASAVSVVETWEGNPQGATNAAKLKTPEEIKVTRVNGRNMTNFLMDDLALDYALLPGKNQVVFNYKTIWAKTGVVSNGESKVHVIESEPQVVRFEAEAGETYHFEFSKPDSRQEAERMMPEFSAAIVSSSGQTVARSEDWTPEDQAMASRTPIPGSPSVGGVSNQGTALDQLKAIWKTASDEEKKTFLRWAFE